MTNTNDEALRQEIVKILKSPMRSQISTADIAVGMMSSTGLGEKVAALVELFSTLTKQREAENTMLQPFEVANYRRLVALESRGVKEYREMRDAPVLTAERVVSFINQLSPWNLKTTGLSVLAAYVESQLKATSQSTTTSKEESK